MWKVYRINTRTGEVKQEDLKESYKMLGGRSLLAQFMMDEVNPKCDPLGHENKLVMCTGIYAGTTVSTAHRMSVGAKSPLTGGIKESNVGGTLAFQLANHGIKMLVFEDIPENLEFKVLHIDKDGNVNLIPAGEFDHINNYEICEKAFDKYGKDVAIASIGVSGERKYLCSGITVSEFGSGHPSRIAARGGLGAVLGSKGIKAVIIEKPETRYKLPVVNQEVYDSARKELAQVIVENSKTSPISNVGTAVNVAATGPTAVMPYKNFSGDICPYVDKVGPTQFMTNLATRGGKNKVACQPGCVVHCSNDYLDKDGKYLTSGFEYETIALCGPNIDISDFDTIAKIDRFCDDFGVDTIEIGCTLGVCMDCGKIPWGDAEAIFKLLDEMKDGTEFGNIMGQGTKKCGEYLGAKRIPVVKGQSLAAYDPRNLKGTGVTYASSPMGADHTAGLTLSAKIDHSAKTMQLYLSRTVQTVFALCDSCMCLMAWGGASSRMDLLIKIYSSIHGTQVTPEMFMGLGVKTLMLEKAFNKAAGFTKDDDKMPDFLMNEKSPFTGATFDFSPDELQSVHDFV